ncbi:hypothetical protein [Neorickettsia findlayensis]|uniref:Transmembrane protein n=1 Tax=Neorickettsia findlayensis TaxID=2686014 RepID=A0A6P1GA51_9RICK|nr:hypothetical protein [Neorickettsia findlayensis]QHD65316.1 hypothetical protein GP480_02560 [Neorickettsia findlayensis]
MLSGIKNTFAEGHQVLQAIVSPGFAAALLAAFTENSSLPEVVVEGIVLKLQQAALHLNAAANEKSSDDQQVAKKDRGAANYKAAVELLNAAILLMDPYARVPGRAPAATPSGGEDTERTKDKKAVSLATVLSSYLYNITDILRSREVGRVTSEQLVEYVARCNRCVWALSCYPVVRSSANVLGNLGSDCVDLATATSALVSVVSSVFGAGLSPQDLQIINGLINDQRNAADAGSLRAVLEACSTGDLEAASEAASGIFDPQTKARVQGCIARTRERQAAINGIPGDITCAISNVSSLATGASDVVGAAAAVFGAGLSPQDLQTMKRLINDQRNAGDAGSLRAVLEACSTGDLEAASEAAAGICNSQTKEQVQGCIARTRERQAAINGIPGDITCAISNVSSLATGASDVVGAAAAVFGAGLSPQDLQTMKRLINDQRNAADAGSLRAVLEACSTGDLEAASEAASGIFDPQTKARVQGCIARTRERQAAINGIPGDITCAISNVSSLATGASDVVGAAAAVFGAGLSPQDLQTMKRLINDQRNAGDAGSLRAVLEACSTGDLEAASEAAAGICNSQTKEQVQGCIARTRERQAAINGIPEDIGDITGGVRRVVASAGSVLQAANEALGTNEFVEDLVDCAGTLYSVILGSEESPVRTVASLKKVLGTMQKIASGVLVKVAAAAASPSVVKSCAQMRRESGIMVSGDSRSVAEAVLADAFSNLFGGLPESANRPINSLSAVYLLVDILENPGSTSADISGAVSAARAQVLTFEYSVSRIKEKHFNTAANGMREIVDAVVDVSAVAGKVTSLFGARSLFRIFVILGIILGALASVGITGVKTFSFSGVLSIIMLCGGIIVLGAAFTQTCRRSGDCSGQLKSRDFCRAVFYALIPGLAFCAAAIVAMLRLVAGDLLTISDASQRLCVERLCIFVGVLFSIVSAVVFNCLDCSRYGVSSSIPLSVPFGAGKAASAHGDLGSTLVLDSVSITPQKGSEVHLSL